MSEQTNGHKPYKGLMPYDESDASFFFGREAEIEVITGNLMASRLTLFYGPSGVGKSSVLRAGVATHLRRIARQNLLERGSPDFAIVVFNQWRDDPVAELLAKVDEAVTQTLNPIASTPSKGSDPSRFAPSRGSFGEMLYAYTERIEGDLLIILDQFEEYFLYHPQEDGAGTFAFEFPRAVNRSDLRVSFLLGVREDMLAKLDRFKGRIPTLFENILRIDHLDREAARAAIERPIESYNRQYAREGQSVSIEPALVEAVLDQVKSGQVGFGEAGRGSLENGASERIETPYLQLVLTRLWDEETNSGSRVLRLETLNRLGGAERIVRTHLDTALAALPASERSTVARVFHYLVTPSGTKIAHTASDLSQYAQVDQAQLSRVLEKLSSSGTRILRPIVPPAHQLNAPPRYEIFHDVLAAAILDWRSRYLNQQRLRRLRLASVAIGSFVLMIIGALVVYAFQLSQEAQTNRAQAQVAQTAVQQVVQIALTAAPTDVGVRATVAALATTAAVVPTPPPIIVFAPPTATPTPAPTATPLPPTATATPLPPTPTPSPTATPPPTATPTPARPPDPPAGTQIVFTSNRNAGVRRIYSMDWTGRDQFPVNYDIAGSIGEFQPDFSFATRSLVFTALVRPEDARVNEQNLFSARWPGVEIKELTRQQFSNWQPVWSPDGKRIAFVSSRAGPNAQLFLMNPDGQGVTRLSDNAQVADDEPSWSPDGKRIVFVSTRGGGRLLHIVEVDTRKVTAISSGLNEDAHPVWVRDRCDQTKIVFARRSDRNGNGSLADDVFNIWTIEADGARAQNLTNARVNEGDPAVSPDGRWVVFARTATANANDIFLMSIGGAEVQQLTNNPADDSLPAWVWLTAAGCQP